VIDRPEPDQLLWAVAAALDDESVAATSDGGSQARYLARVMANLCRILAREYELGPPARAQTKQDLEQLLDGAGPLPELIARLDHALRVDTAPPGAASHGLDPARVYPVLVADVNRRLAIARPDYHEGDR
jgi:hypothetical protein